VINDTLYVEDRASAKLARKNKVHVKTTYSSDGHYTESLYIDYDPNQSGYALFLLENTLNTSQTVKWYSVYDECGIRITDFNKTRLLKRV